MKTATNCFRLRTLPLASPPTGFSLVELLVVISIISLLIGVLMPAINAARESGRQTVCANNLRQFGVGMHSYAQRNDGLMCSGAFDWRWDGSVTEIGWVADLVNTGNPVGEMLCPSNEARISAAYNDLLDMDPSSVASCTNVSGPPAETLPDGSTKSNPCREIVTGSLAAGSGARDALISEKILGKGFNTNFTASWFLVRSQPAVDDNGNLKSRTAGCTASLRSRHSTAGPLSQALIDTSQRPSSFIPLLADGAASEVLARSVGEVPAGSQATMTFTAGPVINPTMVAPSFAGSTPRNGASGWWGKWTNETLQDYRGFAPIHRGACNILFADGSVKEYVDTNDDHLLNNGFGMNSANEFTNGAIELPEQGIISDATLRGL